MQRSSGLPSSSDLDSDPEQHVAVLEDVHDRLQDALAVRTIRA